MKILLIILLSLVTTSTFAQDVGDQDAGNQVVVPAVEEVSPTQALFDTIDGLEKVVVEDQAGVLTLSGEVSSASLRDDAVNLARKQPGTVYVQNRIKLKTKDDLEKVVEVTSEDEQLEEQLNAIFAQVPDLSGVRARVRSGVATLSGETSSSVAVQKSEEVAKSLSGIKYVDNTIFQSVAVGDRLAPAINKLDEIGDGIVQRIPLFLTGLIIYLLFWYGAKFLARVLPMRYLAAQPLAKEFARQGVRVVVVLIGLFVVLEILGLTSLVAALVGTAGVAGIAIGFAFKDIVENYLAGILMGLQQPFAKDDFVDISGYQGKVVRLTTRDTVLMTLDGNHISVPNSVVFKAVIYNYTRNPNRRFDFIVGIGPDQDVAKALQICNKTLAEGVGVLSEPGPTVLVVNIGEYTNDLRLFAWTDQTKHSPAAVKSECIRMVLDALTDAGIDLPEPTRRVLNRDLKLANQAKITKVKGPVGNLTAGDDVDRQIAADREGSSDEDLL